MEYRKIMSEEQEVSTLVNLFAHREKTYQQNTIAILHTIKPTLEGIISYLQVDPNHVSWEAVNLSKGIVTMKMVIATQAFDIYTNKPIYRIISVGVPIELVALGDQTLVEEFLQETEDMKSQIEEGLISEDDDMIYLDDSEEESDEEIEKATEERKTKKVLH